jgi:O-antigen/teichoic acid export membrane protein
MLTFIGQDLFVVLFGPEWAEAGVYVQILSIWTFFWFISSPISNLFSVLERQDLALYINTLIFISRVIALVIGGYLHNARLAILLFGVSGILVYGYLDILLINYSGIAWKQIWRILLINIGIFVPVGVVMFISIWLNAPGWLVLLLAVIITGMYFLYVAQTDPQIRPFIKYVSIFK